MQVISDDLQALMIKQGAGNRFGGGADIDKQRGVIGDGAGHGFGDALLVFAHLLSTHAVGGVTGAAGFANGAAVGTPQQALFGQLIDVATQGLRGYRIALGQLVDDGITGFLIVLKNFVLARC